MLPTAPRRALCRGALVFALAGCAGSGAAFGQSQNAGIPEVRNVALTVLIAHGMSQPGTIDPECQLLQARIRPMRFGTLTAVQKRSFVVPFGTWAQVAMPGGSAVRMVPISVVDGRLHLHVRLPRGARAGLDTRLRMQNRKPFVVGGARYRGGHLLVQIMPEF